MYIKRHKRNANPSEWIIEKIHNLEGCISLIDIACGYGRHTKILNKHFNVTAVDINVDAIQSLQVLDNVIPVVCDLENEKNWPFENSQYDIVLISNYLYRPKIYDLFNLVKKNGYLIYETFAVGNEKLGRPRNPNFLLKPNELPTIMPNNFMQLEYFNGQVDKPFPAIIQRLFCKRI